MRSPYRGAGESASVLGVPIQAFLPPTKLAPDVIGLAQRVLTLAVIEQCRVHRQPQAQAEPEENEVGIY